MFELESIRKGRFSANLSPKNTRISGFPDRLLILILILLLILFLILIFILIFYLTPPCYCVCPCRLKTLDMGMVLASNNEETW